MTELEMNSEVENEDFDVEVSDEALDRDEGARFSLRCAPRPEL